MSCMLFPFQSFQPKLGRGAFVHPTAAVVGKVSLGERASVWPNASLRADLNRISVGAGSNVQDNAALHVSRKFPVKVGKFVSIGHGAIVHGCTIGDHCIVGMGAIVLNGARVGKNCLVAAGALVPEGRRVPAGSLVMGVPGKVVRRLTRAEIQRLKANALEYLALANAHAGRRNR